MVLLGCCLHINKIPPFCPSLPSCFTLRLLVSSPSLLFFVYLLRRFVTFLPRFSSLPLFPFLPHLLSSSWRLVLSCSRPLSFYPLQIYTPTRRCSRRVSVALMRPRSCYFIARPHAKMCLRYSCELGVSEENELLVCGRA